jgi:hypothetical protein
LPLQREKTRHRSGFVKGTERLEDAIDELEREGLADEIYALSVSTNPKFLKDRKGNLWRVETGNAVTMKNTDKAGVQPYLAAIPWVEVAGTRQAR